MRADDSDLPVTLELFMKYTHYEEVVDKILEDKTQGNAQKLQELLISDRMRQKVLRNYHRAFYTQPEIRRKYPVRFKPMPRNKKDTFLQYAKSVKDCENVEWTGSNTANSKQLNKGRSDVEVMSKDDNEALDNDELPATSAHPHERPANNEMPTSPVESHSVKRKKREGEQSPAKCEKSNPSNLIVEQEQEANKDNQVEMDALISNDLPVSLELFMRYTHYEEIVDKILEDKAQGNAQQLQEFLNSDRIRQKVLRKYHSAFYTQPKIRRKYPVRFKPMPRNKRDTFLQYAKSVTDCENVEEAVEGTGSNTTNSKQLNKGGSDVEVLSKDVNEALVEVDLPTTSERQHERPANLEELTSPVQSHVVKRRKREAEQSPAKCVKTQFEDDLPTTSERQHERPANLEEPTLPVQSHVVKRRKREAERSPAKCVKSNASNRIVEHEQEAKKDNQVEMDALDSSGLPVPLELFMRYTHYEEIVQKILEDKTQGNAQKLQELLNSDKIRQRVLRKYHSAFYTEPKIRRKYPIRFKPMPKNQKDTFLQYAKSVTDCQDVEEIVDRTASKGASDGEVMPKNGNEALVEDDLPTTSGRQHEIPNANLEEPTSPIQSHVVKRRKREAEQSPAKCVKSNPSSRIVEQEQEANKENQVKMDVLKKTDAVKMDALNSNDLPVPLELFMRYTHYEEIVQKILEDKAQGNAKKLQQHLNSDTIRQRVLRKYHSAFYTEPKIRRKYPIRFKPMPKNQKDTFLQYAKSVKDCENVEKTGSNAVNSKQLNKGGSDGEVMSKDDNEGYRIVEQETKKDNQVEIDVLNTNVAENNNNIGLQIAGNCIIAANDYNNSNSIKTTDENISKRRSGCSETEKMEIENTWAARELLPLAKSTNVAYLKQFAKCCPLTFSQFKKYTNLMDIVKNECDHDHVTHFAQKMYLIHYIQPDFRKTNPIIRQITVTPNCPDRIKAKVFEIPDIDKERYESECNPAQTSQDNNKNSAGVESSDENESSVSSLNSKSAEINENIPIMNKEILCQATKSPRNERNRVEILEVINLNIPKQTLNFVQQMATENETMPALTTSTSVVSPKASHQSADHIKDPLCKFCQISMEDFIEESNVNQVVQPTEHYDTRVREIFVRFMQLDEDVIKVLILKGPLMLNLYKHPKVCASCEQLWLMQNSSYQKPDNNAVDKANSLNDTERNYTETTEECEESNTSYNTDDTTVIEQRKILENLSNSENSSELTAAPGGNDIKGSDVDAMDMKLISANKNWFDNFRHTLCNALNQPMDCKQFPVSLKEYIENCAYHVPLQQIIREFCGSEVEMVQSVIENAELYNSLRGYFYKKFFTNSKLRRKYPLRLVSGCEDSVRNRLYSFMKTTKDSSSVNENRETTENDSSENQKSDFAVTNLEANEFLAETSRFASTRDSHWLVDAEKLFGGTVHKTHTLAYVLRTSFGLKQQITQMLSDLSLKEFKSITRIYECQQSYNNDEFLEFVYQKATINWPEDLYVEIEDLLLKLVKSPTTWETTIDLSSILVYISPKFLHWSNLLYTTNFIACVCSDYLHRMGHPIDVSNFTSLEEESKNYYRRCWNHEQWIGNTPLVNECVLNSLGSNKVEANITSASEAYVHVVAFQPISDEITEQNDTEVVTTIPQSSESCKNVNTYLNETTALNALHENISDCSMTPENVSAEPDEDTNYIVLPNTQAQIVELPSDYILPDNDYNDPLENMDTHKQCDMDTPGINLTIKVEPRTIQPLRGMTFQEKDDGSVICCPNDEEVIELDDSMHISASNEMESLPSQIDFSDDAIVLKKNQKCANLHSGDLFSGGSSGSSFTLAQRLPSQVLSPPLDNSPISLISDSEDSGASADSVETEINLQVSIRPIATNAKLQLSDTVMSHNDDDLKAQGAQAHNTLDSNKSETLASIDRESNENSPNVAQFQETQPISIKLHLPKACNNMDMPNRNGASKSNAKTRGKNNKTAKTGELVPVGALVPQRPHVIRPLPLAKRGRSASPTAKSGAEANAVLCKEPTAAPAETIAETAVCAVKLVDTAGNNEPSLNNSTNTERVHHISQFEARPEPLRVSQELLRDCTLFNNTSLLMKVDQANPPNTKSEDAISAERALEIRDVRRSSGHSPAKEAPKSSKQCSKVNSTTTPTSLVPKSMNKFILHYNLREFLYFDPLKSHHISEYKLRTNALGLRHTEGTFQFGKLRTKLTGGNLAPLGLCSEAMTKDFSNLLRDIGEFQYKPLQTTDIERKEDIRQRVLYAYLRGVPPFCFAQVTYGVNDSEYSECKNIEHLGMSDVPKRRPYKCLTNAIKPHILQRMKELKDEIRKK